VKSEAQPINEEKLKASIGKIVGDFGAALSSALVYIGLKLGLYKTMAGAQPVTPAELAQRTGTVERYVREWLINQAASGYVEYDPASGRYHLPPEPEVALTDENSPFFVGFTSSRRCCALKPASPKPFRRGAACSGVSMIPIYSSAPSASSGRVTRLTLSQPGFLR
jgi:Rv2258c-like winged HTH domain